MFAEEIRRQAEAAPRTALPEVAKALWRAFGEGKVSEAEAEALSALIEARQGPSRDPQTAPRADDARRPGEPRAVHRGGSRPRTPRSLDRRRRYAASGRLPPHLAADFTAAEQAVLAVLAVEVLKHGDCRLPIGQVAALAGCGETTVRNAIREARKRGLVTVEERRLTAWRNATNVVRVVSVEWSSWLRMGGRLGGWVQFREPHDSLFFKRTVETAGIVENGLARGGRQHPQGQDGPPLRRDEPWQASRGWERQP